MDFEDSSYIIAFVYRDFGIDRDTPYVYWDNHKWVQLMYDAFRERWSDSYPVLYGAVEAITIHFGLDRAELTFEEIAVSSPDMLRSRGKTEPVPDAVYLENVTQFVRWTELETKTEYMAEQFVSGEWRLGVLDKQAQRWDIAGLTFSDDEIITRYKKYSPNIRLLGGLPPAGTSSL
ncbi:MAG: hypothetical protein JW712_02610 [Dehalococcoidales bacterium]|nr:hypothetical protein [Dehalococcoidales bacterium]